MHQSFWNIPHMEKILIDRDTINTRIQQLGDQISVDFLKNYGSHEMPPVFICVLNGAFHFFSELTRCLHIDCQVDFIRLKSYNGQDNSEGVSVIKGLELELKGRHVYIVDDILDSGNTIMEALRLVNDKMPATVNIVTMLTRAKNKFQPNYYAFEIGDEFIVGYGLDNNGLSRNLEDLYAV